MVSVFRAESSGFSLPESSGFSLLRHGAITEKGVCRQDLADTAMFLFVCKDDITNMDINIITNSNNIKHKDDFSNGID